MGKLYKQLREAESGKRFSVLGHELQLKAKTLADDFVFAELGDDYDDCYVLAQEGVEFGEAVFHVHLDLPAGNRFDLEGCEWLFKDGDVHEGSFTDQVLNQADGQDYVYKKVFDRQTKASVDTPGGQMDIVINLALFKCDDGPSDPYFLICEYGEGLESGLSCLVGEKFSR